MKKKVGVLLKKLIASLIILGVFIFVLIKSPLYTYYTDTYKSTTAYARVPKELPEKQQTKDSNGQIVPDSYSYFYSFHFIKEDGVAQDLTFELSGEDVTPLEPGKLIRAQISKKRIIKGPFVIKKSKIPQSIMNNLSMD